MSCVPMDRRVNKIPDPRWEFDQEIKEMYTCTRQYSQKAIAESLNISIDMVRERLRENNIPMRTRSESQKGRITDIKRRNEILFWHKQGLNTTEIAEKLGCSSSNVVMHFRRAGINLPRHKKVCKHGHNLTKPGTYIEKEKKDTRSGNTYTVRVCKKCYDRWHSRAARRRRLENVKNKQDNQD